MKFFFYTLLTATLLAQVACQNTDSTELVIPPTYDFENVDYQGQIDRIHMLQELSNVAKSANALNAPQVSASKLTDMYQNVNSPFSEAILNGSTKNLKSKVYPNSGTPEAFEQYFVSLQTISQYTNRAAAPGVAGIATGLDGTTTYLLNNNGMELAQLIEKGLAAACMYYQATEVYLGPVKMNVDNKAVTPGTGTAMEHHWDEAFGYFGAPTDFPSNISNLELWAKYSNKVSPSLGSNSRLMNAFLKGRAAISASQYDVRDEQIEIIRKEWELVLAAVAISYLNDAKSAQTDPALYYHYLTEAYAFLMGIKYGSNHTITDATVDTMLQTLADNADPLQANFYNTAVQDIDNTINAIAASYTQLESIKASL